MQLTIQNSDIASTNIENIINPYTATLDNIKKFIVIDKSVGLFGIFLGMLKNMRNVEELYVDVDDRNLATLFEEFLPRMPHLKKLSLPRVAKEATFNVIKSNTSLRELGTHVDNKTFASSLFVGAEVFEMSSN